MPTVNIDKMTYVELCEHRDQVLAKIEQVHNEERQNIAQQVEELVAAQGFSINEIIREMKPTKRTNRVAPKYRNPRDWAETWTGRGRKPKWMERELAEGASLEEFLI